MLLLLASWDYGSLLLMNKNIFQLMLVQDLIYRQTSCHYISSIQVDCVDRDIHWEGRAYVVRYCDLPIFSWKGCSILDKLSFGGTPIARRRVNPGRLTHHQTVNRIFCQPPSTKPWQEFPLCKHSGLIWPRDDRNSRILLRILFLSLLTTSTLWFGLIKWLKAKNFV